MIRRVSILFALLALTLLAGCASEEELSTGNHPPVAGEATPPPAPPTGAQSGWKW